MRNATDNKKTTRHYYGFDWQYGVGTWWSEHDGSSHPCGAVYVFDSATARDDWVRGDTYRDGNPHLSSMDAKTAVAEMRRVVRDDWTGIYDDDVSSLPVDRLIAAYDSITTMYW